MDGKLLQETQRKNEGLQKECEQRFATLMSHFSTMLKQATTHDVSTAKTSTTSSSSCNKSPHFSFFSYDINDTKGFCKSISRPSSYQEAILRRKAPPLHRKPPMVRKVNSKPV